MELITVFYQAEGLSSVEFMDIAAAETVAALRGALREKHRFPAEVLLFAEDIDDALDDATVIGAINVVGGTKIHAHRCRRVRVEVSFNGQTLPFQFAPSATIARVTRHVAIEGFHISKETAAEHVLQIKGSATQPAPATHVGSLVKHPACGIAFDLVPKARVQGAYPTVRP
jgi:hypothetical protein